MFRIVSLSGEKLTCSDSGRNGVDRVLEIPWTGCTKCVE